jgi:hypothetical protein
MRLAHSKDGEWLKDQDSEAREECDLDDVFS